MSEEELDAIEAELPKLAVEALAEASRDARASGLPVVVLEGQELVRIGPEGRTVLKTLPPSVKAETKVKRATS